MSTLLLKQGFLLIIYCLLTNREKKNVCLAISDVARHKIIDGAFDQVKFLKFVSKID